ncbi:DUF5626 family protein [Lactiplantibacillus plantarum]|uniref:DUF5626 family protein n=1 Tax=Lactiplantibacillus plantarum TaxID=1590 RepID=UPI003334AA9A
MKQSKFILLLLCSIYFVLYPTTVRASSYNISHTSALSWKASYRITISKNKITKISKIHYKAITGHITASKMVQSKHQSTLYLTRKVGAICYKVGLRSTIKKGKMTVSVL